MDGSLLSIITLNTLQIISVNAFAREPPPNIVYAALRKDGFYTNINIKPPKIQYTKKTKTANEILSLAVLKYFLLYSIKLTLSRAAICNFHLLSIGFLVLINKVKIKHTATALTVTVTA